MKIKGEKGKAYLILPLDWILRHIKSVFGLIFRFICLLNGPIAVKRPCIRSEPWKWTYYILSSRVSANTKTIYTVFHSMDTQLYSIIFMMENVQVQHNLSIFKSTFNPKKSTTRIFVWTPRDWKQFIIEFRLNEFSFAIFRLNAPS